MPTQWSHSLFFAAKAGGPAPTFRDDLLLMGVGRGGAAMFILFTFELEPLVSLALLLVLLGTLFRPDLKSIFQRIGGGENAEFFARVHGPDGEIAKRAVWAKLPDPKKEEVGGLNFQRALENSYNKATSMSPSVSGWELKVLVWYWVGVRLGKW